MTAQVLSLPAAALAVTIGDVIAQMDVDVPGTLWERLGNPVREGVDYWIPANHLPAGWVSLIHWPYPYTDATDSWSGPIVAETTTHIQISVFGELLRPFRKDDCTGLVRSEVTS